MSDKNLEDLSALIDGYLSQQAAYRLIDLSITDPTLRAAWTRYHLIGDALRYNLPKKTRLDLAKQVSSALESEPILLVPRQRSWRGAIPIAGLAIAASVAMVAVLGLYKADRGAIGPEPQQVAQQTIIRATNTLPVSTVRWDNQPSSPPSRLNSYLLNHNQYNSGLGLSMQGVSPYVRIVSYESGQ